MLMRDFEAIVAYLNGKLGDYSPDDIEDIADQAANGQTAYTGTQVYRASGAPTNDPAPTGISQTHAPNGTMLLTLGWGQYTQGAVPADFLYVFSKWDPTGDPGTPDVNCDNVAVMPNTSGAVSHTFPGLNPSYKWSFAIAAARKTESGFEIGSLVSHASWLNVTIGTPNFTGQVSGTAASTVATATGNFNARNDRKATQPADPTIAADGTAVDHVLNDDASATISLEWSFSGIGDAGDIDGFNVYVHVAATNTPYVFGTDPSSESVYRYPYDAVAFILPGVSPEKWYTFGVQAYRNVDQDIDSDGVKISAIVQPSLAAEDPYQPSANLDYKGNISGTIDGSAVEDVLQDIADALSDAAGAQATADSKIVTFYQAAIPTSTDVGDLWVDTDDDNKLYRAECVGANEIKAGEWVLARDAGIAQALSNAAGAQATADGKIVTFYQDAAPTAEAAGDLWFDTNDNNKMYRWNGSAWQSARDAAKITTFYADSAPTALATGDLWYDSNDNNKCYRWSSSAWVSVRDAGKITTFYATSAPTAEATGDIWYDTDDGNKAYRWSGAAWISVRDDAATNFDTRNDRKSTTPAVPVFAGDGSAVEHVLNADGSADIRLVWTHSGSGDAYDIDGFVVYHRQSTSSGAYTFGSTPNEEEVAYVPSSQKNRVFQGVSVVKYHTFGVRAYRAVDQDIDATGVKQSAIVKPSYAGEDPYQPSTSVVFEGDLDRTDGYVSGQNAAMVAKAAGFGDGSDGALSTTGDVTLSVTADAGPVVKQYTSVVINAGHTVSVNNRCKGLVILCQGDVTINGTISMDNKAARVTRDDSTAPWDEVGYVTLWQTKRGVACLINYLIAAGGAGGDGGDGGGYQDGAIEYGPGGTGGTGGSNCAFGGSGGGGGGSGYTYDSKTGGGGGGGGGNGGAGGNYYNGVAGKNDGAAGGVGAGTGAAGGTGQDAARTGDAGGLGGGGIIVIVAKGNLTIGATGIVSASSTGDGGQGGDAYAAGANENAGGGGGAPGGGVAVLACDGTYTNLGSVLVNAGNGGLRGACNVASHAENGQNGQVGSIITY